MVGLLEGVDQLSRPPDKPVAVDPCAGGECQSQRNARDCGVDATREDSHPQRDPEQSVEKVAPDVEPVPGDEDYQHCGSGPEGE